jgi:hypothetical protein
MDFIFFIFFGVVVIVVLLGLFFRRDARIRRAIKKLPVVKVKDFADGTIGRVVGQVRVIDETTAPMSGRPCAQYHLIVKQQRRSGRSSHWVTLVDEQRMVDFVVEDASGRAVVDTTGAQVAVVKDASARSGTFNSATPELEALLARHGHSSTGFLGFNKTIRYQEGVIEEGEMVAVCGLGRIERRAGSPRGQLVIGPTAEGPVRISDHPSTCKP